ncbi:MAG: GIY-YIG nuclease family protein [Eubacterium sp.]|nr:GIY-YIG nuclease family protein [Eubacterium sp.]
MDKANEQNNYTYILKCADGSFYCGWTNQLEKRLKAHNAGTGAKYTRTRRPVELIYYETFVTKQEAMSREYHIKRMTRKEKEALVSHQKNLDFEKSLMV